MDEFPPPKYIDDVTCHEKWSETTQVLLGPPPATVKIEFCVYRWTSQVPVHIDRVSPVARTTMTAEAARGLRDQLSSALTALEQQSQLVQMPLPTPTKN